MARPAAPPRLFRCILIPQEVGAPSLGHIAENRHIRAALHAASVAEPNLEMIAPASVTRLEVEPGFKLGDHSE